MPARRITDPVRNASIIDPRETPPAPPAPIAPAGERSLAGNNAAGDNRLRADVIDSRAASVEDATALSKRQRVTAAARDVVEEKLSPRVEKLRHASNTMLGEAAYDPSLRFVLVAIIILILSLLLLLLNYLIG
jgi:membrane-bound ClpP family serine protease